MHVRSVAHTRFLFDVGATVSYSLEELQVRMVVQPRLLVLVGARLSYSEAVQLRSAVHWRLLVTVGPKLWYSTPEQLRNAAHWRLDPTVHGPVSYSTLAVHVRHGLHTVFCVTVHALTRYVDPIVQLLQLPHCWSCAALGMRVWYVRPALHSCTLWHTRLDVTVAGVCSYSMVL